MNKETKAWKVTVKNTSTLSHISGVVIDAFKANIGWIMVEDWNERPRFLLMPERIFKDIYPNIELTTLKVDDETEE